MGPGFWRVWSIRPPVLFMTRTCQGPTLASVKFTRVMVGIVPSGTLIVAGPVMTGATSITSTC